MVFLIAASSLHHAVEALTPDEKNRYKEKVFFDSGPMFESTHKKSVKIVENLSKDLKDKNILVIWHDFINNSISRHDSNNFNALSVLDLINVLEGLQDRLSSVVYCHRFRNP